MFTSLCCRVSYPVDTCNCAREGYGRQGRREAHADRLAPIEVVPPREQDEHHHEEGDEVVRDVDGGEKHPGCQETDVLRVY